MTAQLLYLRRYMLQHSYSKSVQQLQFCVCVTTVGMPCIWAAVVQCGPSPVAVSTRGLAAPAPFALTLEIRVFMLAVPCCNFEQCCIGQRAQFEFIWGYLVILHQHRSYEVPALPDSEHIHVTQDRSTAHLLNQSFVHDSM